MTDMSLISRKQLGRDLEAADQTLDGSGIVGPHKIRWYPPVHVP